MTWQRRRLRVALLAGCCLGMVVAWTLLALGPASAQEACQGKRGLDPRTGRLQVIGLRITSQGVVGTLKNTSSDTALGAMIWVNYYATRRGGPTGQQCIPVGDLRSGEEKAFAAAPIPEAGGSEAFDYAADAAGWK
jgi:hypothetical protein